ncbi:SNF2-related protein, partial [Streptomyces sp. NPDC089799]|uniref:DEAD/DEAH box helicase n=1 Tax=Streptomyces sp. NPDC089799 TaxID=3155066 RepID=UPI00343EFDAD
MLPKIDDLIRCSAVFLPADPARSGRVAFLPPEDEPLPVPAGPGSPELLLVVGPGLRPVPSTALVLPLRDALPVLVRARVRSCDGLRPTGASAPAAPSPAAAFWGAAALLALDFTARGLLLPGLTASDHDAWRIGPLDAAGLGRVRELAAAMPPAAHCVPVDGEPLRLPAPEALLRRFLDAVADTLPRTPAAPAAAGGPAFAATGPARYPALRSWAAEVAAGHDAGVRISLRVELADRPPAREAPGFRAVLQLHGVADPALVADAAAVWSGAGAVAAGFAPRARMDALLALRRAARLWPPLSPLLTAAVPHAVDLADEEVLELLGEPGRALAADGVPVHWPRDLVRGLTPRAVLGGGSSGASGAGRPGGVPGLLSPGALLSFDWRHTLGAEPGAELGAAPGAAPGSDLTPAELDRLAEAARPLVRLRDRWVLVDPAEARRARARQEHKVTAADALAAVLTGSAEVDGRRVGVTATGELERLRAALTADPELVPHQQQAPHGEQAAHGERSPHPESAARPEASAGVRPFVQPAALTATLRDYQVRGLAWLDRMTSLGLGGCLADDMGLGKTVTLIALHLHRQQDPATPGPTLVVCPASLLGNWQREIGKFAPGTPVRRFHGPGRDLAGLPAGAVVLTTYGTMRLEVPALAATAWGMVVADEAQHIKNPRSSTARALRAVPAPARIALTGTPVENNLTELWAVLDWTTPGVLGRLGSFRSRYADAVESGRDPRAAARLAALVRPFLLRRRKSDPGIAPELPPKTETDHPVSLTAEQASLYEAVVRETLDAISTADGMERRGLVVRLLTSLKQICNHPAQFLKEERPRIPHRSGKLALLDELLDTILAEGGSVLVFTQYVTMARILQQHLDARGVDSQLLHGG